MITINLLPKKIKKEIESKKANIWIVGMFILSLVILGLTIELFFATKKLLSSNLGSLEDQYQAFEQYFDSEKNKEIEDNVNNTNRLFINIDKIQTERTLWSNVLLELSRITPSEITLYGIEIDKLGNKVEISGHAESREKLLQYEESLKDFNYFQNIDLPSNYLINPSDITFKINAALNQEDTKEK